jgi:hypothetical protein
VPDAPFDRIPYLVGGWLLIGGVVILFVPGLRDRVASGIRAAEATQT